MCLSRLPWFQLLGTQCLRKSEAEPSSRKSYFLLLFALLSPWRGSPVGALTQADGGFACPAAICFAGAVLRAALEGEALLAGVDECVAHGGQVQGPDVGMGWRLWLLAVVGWTRGDTVGPGSVGPSTIPVPRRNMPRLSPSGPSHVQHPLPCLPSPPSPGSIGLDMMDTREMLAYQPRGTAACSTYPEGRGVTKVKSLESSISRAGCGGY